LKIFECFVFKNKGKVILILKQKKKNY